MDGNNSTKRVDTGFRQQGDTRTFNSDFFLEVSEVDKFKLEDIRVKGPEVPLFDEDVGIEDKSEEDGDGTVSSETGKGSITECVKNWKAAQVDSKPSRRASKPINSPDQ